MKQSELQKSGIAYSWYMYTVPFQYTNLPTLTSNHGVRRNDKNVQKTEHTKIKCFCSSMAINGMSRSTNEIWTSCARGPHTRSETVNRNKINTRQNIITND